MYAAELEPRSLTLSNDVANAAPVNYNFGFTIATGGTLGSIEFQFCSNSPLVGDVCTPPPGFDASSTSLGQVSGQSGFTISNTSTANTIILTRPPANASPGASSYEFLLIQNPNSAGPLFGRIQTFASSNASGPATDSGGVATYITGGVGVSAEVPPFLLFCLGESITGTDCTTATDPFSDLGTLSPVVTSAAQSQIVVATNAGNGYSMWATGTTMTSGNNTITAMNGGTSQKGTSQFGINLTTNTTPAIGQNPAGPGSGAVLANYNQADHFRFLTGDPLVSAAVPDDFRKYTVSYIVNIPQGQPGGVYSTTLTYVCLGNF